MTRHRAVEEQLGAYALGALEPRERADVEAHLRDCPSCREEVARLAALPGLLARLGPEDTAAPPAPVPDLAERALATVARRRREARRTRRLRWGAGAVAAVAVVLALVGRTVGGDGGSGGGVALRIEPVAADAGGVTGTASAEGRAWGTAIAVDLRHLPSRPGYVLAAIANDGRRETAATWAATTGGAATVSGSCSIRPADMAGYEVTAADGEVLLELSAATWRSRPR